MGSAARAVSLFARAGQAQGDWAGGRNHIDNTSDRVGQHCFTDVRCDESGAYQANPRPVRTLTDPVGRKLNEFLMLRRGSPPRETHTGLPKGRATYLARAH